MNKTLATLSIVLIFACALPAQVPTTTLIKIVKAEDSRTYDASLEALTRSPIADIRKRAALAAGRIGVDLAIPALTALLEGDTDADVRAMAAFAIGEIESPKGADAILKALQDPKTTNAVRARAVEAAGKIAAANTKDEKSKALGAAILDSLGDEQFLADINNDSRSRSVVLAGLTAVLRARPVGGEVIVAKYLLRGDERIRADAANTLTRLRAKNANETLRKMIVSDPDPVARANAARALGAAEDKEAFDLLVTAATNDADPRVRVSAIRSLAALKDAKAVDKLLVHGRKLLKLHSNSKLVEPNETGELLEISTALGRLSPNTEDQGAVTFINEFRMSDGFASPENEIALARVAPKAYVAARLPDDFGYRDPRIASAYAQGLAEIATSKDDALKLEAAGKLTSYIAGLAKGVRPADQAKMLNAMPELMQATAAFKPDNLDEILRGQIANVDVFVRASAAGLLADRPVNKENIDALSKAFTFALLRDQHTNDAQLAIMDALFKLDKKGSVGSFLIALSAPDYLVRKKAFEFLADKEIQDASPGVPTSLKLARSKHKDQVLPYLGFGTKQGQILNTDDDYRRAVSRKNGSVKAVFTTEKGTFTIDFTPEEAPLTVDNFVKLARSGYFNGLEVHRVVPNFVMQDGDPRGDGNGGPGWSIRCEVNMLSYDRGAVGMALSGKDTGGSQWFVTHSPQPHLDGGYTVFGHVNETGMKVVDNIVRGDKIISVKIVETLPPRIRAKK